MVKGQVDLSTRAWDYGDLESSKDKFASDSQEPLHIERHTIEALPWILKGSLKHSNLNLNARVN